MPSGSIPHGTQRPDSDSSHENRQENSYERALINATAAPFVTFPVAAYLDQRLSHRDKSVLMGMCWHANRKHLVWCKQQTIAEEMHLPISKISLSIAQLIACGYVEIVRKSYRGAENPALRTNKYRILWANVPDDEELEEPPPVHISPSGNSIFTATVNHIYRSGKQNNTNEQYQSSRNREDVDDGEETRVNARALLTEKIVSAGNLPRQTNRAALAQLVANHPQISAGDWEFQAAAAAEWFADHERRLTLASFASWITRYLRERQQLTAQPAETPEQAEQEQSHGRPSQHRRSHGAGRSAAQSGRVPADLRYPAGPDDPTDDTIPEGANEEELVEYYRRLTIERRRAEQVAQAERQARLN